MVCYLDLYFLVNCGMDVSLLLILRTLLKSRTGIRRLFLGSMAGAALSCAALWLTALPTALSLPLEVFVPAAVMVWIAFRPGDVRTFLKFLLILLLEAFLMGGVMESLYQNLESGGRSPSVAWILVLLPLAFGAVYVLWDWGFEVRRERRMLRTVILQAVEKTVTAIGYLDTGNHLSEPQSGRPVHIVSEKLWRQLHQPETPVFSVFYHTVGNPLGQMEVMELSSLKVLGDKVLEDGREHGKEAAVYAPALVARAPYELCRDGSYELLLNESAE